MVVFTSGIVDERPVVGLVSSQYYSFSLLEGCGTWGCWSGGGLDTLLSFEESGWDALLLVGVLLVT